MILVTGASGLLGAHLLATGLARGETLRATSRTAPARSYLAHARDGREPRLEIVPADLLAPDLDPALVRGVDTVVHAAGLASPFARDAPAMDALNVDATVRLFDLARAGGVQRWVQVSSVAALAGRASDTGGAPAITEDEPARPRDTAYGRSKWRADRAIAERARSDPGRAAIRVLTVHPTYMLGPWDARPSSSAIFLAVRLRRVRRWVSCTRNFAAAADVAAGIWRALDAGVTGAYLLGGVDADVGEFLRLVSEEVGRAPSALSEISAADAVRELDPDELAISQELSSPSSVTSAKARRDFGYDPTRELAPLVAETAAWLRSVKLLPPKVRT